MASTCSAAAPQVPAQEMVLSRNYESSQLHTPKQLDRITIDNPHFQDHIGQSGTSSKNVRLQKPRIMGDKYFFLQKDIPVHQLYSRTALKLSHVRPWDQLVVPPLKTGSILSKELTLPFPRQHPFTSHTPNFAVFPDTQPYCYQSPLHTQHPAATTSHAEDTVQGGKVHAQTQTSPPDEAIGVARPPFLYYVAEKATKNGMRVERRYINSSPGIPLVGKSREMLWEYPGSRRHQRSATYPAPSCQYSRPPTTPYYLPPPSTTNFSQPPTPAVPYTPGPGSISQSTQSALDTIHSMVSRSTTYRDHFTPRTHTQLQLNKKADYSISSRLSHRPWTDESRGKYNSDFPTGPICDPLLSDDEDGSEEDAGGECEGDKNKPDLDPSCQVQEDGVSPSNDDDAATPTKQAPSNPIETTHQKSADEDTKAEQEMEMSDASTQTDEAYFGGSNTALDSSLSSPHYTSPPTVRMDETSSSDIPSPSLASGSPPSRNPIDSLTAKLYKLPLLDHQPATGRGDPVSKQAEQSPRVHSAGDQWARGGNISTTQKQDLERRKSLSQPSVSHKLQALSKVRPATEGGSQLRTPRTVESTRRMMQVFNHFNRSDSMRQFHQCYQESVAPDLRQFSMRQGKRHIIHGTHAYYFH